MLICPVEKLITGKKNLCVIPHLQQAAVYGAGTAPEGLLRVHEWVFSIEGHGAMWLHMLSAVRCGAGEAGADSWLFDAGADVAPHHLLT